MALGHDGRIQKLTVRTPPNNENEFALAKVASKSEKIWLNGPAQRAYLTPPVPKDSHVLSTYVEKTCVSLISTIAS